MSSLFWMLSSGAWPPPPVTLPIIFEICVGVAVDQLERSRAVERGAEQSSQSDDLDDRVAAGGGRVGEDAIVLGEHAT